MASGLRVVRRAREPATFGHYPLWPAPYMCYSYTYGTGEELSTPTEIVTHAHDVAPGPGKPEGETPSLTQILR